MHTRKTQQRDQQQQYMITMKTDLSVKGKELFLGNSIKDTEQLESRGLLQDERPVQHGGQAQNECRLSLRHTGLLKFTRFARQHENAYGRRVTRDAGASAVCGVRKRSRVCVPCVALPKGDGWDVAAMATQHPFEHRKGTVFRSVRLSSDMVQAQHEQAAERINYLIRIGDARGSQCTVAQTRRLGARCIGPSKVKKSWGEKRYQTHIHPSRSMAQYSNECKRARRYTRFTGGSAYQFLLVYKWNDCRKLVCNA